MQKGGAAAAKPFDKLHRYSGGGIRKRKGYLGFSLLEDYSDGKLFPKIKKRGILTYPSFFMERVTRLVRIFCPAENYCFAPSSRREQRSSALHLIIRTCLSLFQKRKTTQKCGLSFLERVTRLELATSTLARWRSTG